MTFKFRLADAAIAISALMLSTIAVSAVELDPAAVIYKLPDQIEWKGTGGNRSAVLVGDPQKPGLYVQMVKWLAGNNFSRPHFHPNDRFITVLKGTWWVGTGKKFDPANTVAMPAGTFVTHFGKQVHWTGPRTRTRSSSLLAKGRRPLHGSRRRNNLTARRRSSSGIPDEARRC
jgi:hypothetical protein